MVLLLDILLLALTWLYNNLYDYFAFFSGMYVTIQVVNKAIDMADGDGSDLEDVFEECLGELVPVAPLAQPEEFGTIAGVKTPLAKRKALGNDIDIPNKVQCAEKQKDVGTNDIPYFNLENNKVFERSKDVEKHGNSNRKVSAVNESYQNSENIKPLDVLLQYRSNNMHNEKEASATEVTKQKILEDIIQPDVVKFVCAMPEAENGLLGKSFIQTTELILWLKERQL